MDWIVQSAWVKSSSVIRNLDSLLDTHRNFDESLLDQFPCCSFVSEGYKSKIGWDRGNIGALFLVDIADLNRGDLVENFEQIIIVDSDGNEVYMDS